MTKRVEYDCALSPEEYWALRDDDAYAQYVAINGDPPTNTVELSLDEGASGVVTRSASVTASRSLSMLCKNSSTIRVLAERAA